MGRGCNESAVSRMRSFSPSTTLNEKEFNVEKRADSDLGQNEKTHQRVEVKYPGYMSRTVVSALVFVMAATMRGKLGLTHIV